VTGQVDRRTLTRLEAMTREPTRAELFNVVVTGPPLDPRCTTGRAMCVDKTSRSLRWVVDGVVLRTVEVRFGSDELPTREGGFAVFRKSRDHVSSLYGTSMPFAMFFSGGQAVHYSPDFAANGYAGASHGCVNVRDRAAVAWLFDQVRLGDKVVVYRS
jgi:lipoprotein-anchoring transpeptidase ErfK/SrfK